ncbi:DNA/RNA nuclease SfsA [Pseudaestuariivita sp.]|uniref:DNA/RNA nuclease SfsA n=1 Tax=Pseudaestuariivita sp. TaxID=2211669 RepID=UPI00405A2E41
MRFPTPLVRGTLIRRYKRFLADVTLADGREVTAHCANPGSMMGLAEPGMCVWLEPNDDPKKKLKFGWRLVEVPGGFVGVDTGAANRIVREALEARSVEGLLPYETFRAEVKYGNGSRVDFLLEGARPHYLEVKSVTLSRSRGLAEFPDSVTARGAKHLGELAAMVAEGCDATLLYLVQRSDCDRVSVAADIDPSYASALAEARAAGVQVRALGTEITPEGIRAGRALPVL